ncbi:hypothetical protein BU204_00460 [Actinophytocola xanthii]|uniref:Uncharacterized protein n=1 Tax=Actinophytocola xanthii TaxID=1912961 RepID=A0A1Q8CYK9_9PSEU|nr:hypothetical protein BU204_00460 [Actinophytocola xanthii]
MVTEPGMRCWRAAPGGDPVPVDGPAGVHPPGAPVVVGPAGADPGAAVGQLVLLVAGGTEVAAGAGVHLGGGFTSARLDGAAGDRRDALLAAARFLGPHATDRLGDRTSVLVALFGLSATKRVGAAAATAMAQEQWGALQLASAVSDLLGPEQLERVLELRAPEGTDPFPRGAASTLSHHLSAVLSGFPRPRRLTLVVSLWEHVCGHLLAERRLAALVAAQTGVDQLERLRERYDDHFDEPLARDVRRSLQDPIRIAEVARWRPPAWWPAWELTRLVNDAIAATALLRFARTMSDEGFAVAARRHREELDAADACLSKAEWRAAGRRVEGAYDHPARPGRYVHDLCTVLRPDQPVSPSTEAYVRERVALARNYGLVVLATARLATRRVEREPLSDFHGGPWQVPALRRWREVSGFRRTPGDWEQPPLPDRHADAPNQTLARRTAAEPDRSPVELEAPHDLLWLCDLADALAPFYGNQSARVIYEPTSLDLRYDTPPEPDPTRPSVETVPLAAAGVAQLVAFGGTPPARCGSWGELVDAVLADTGVVQADTDRFPLPPEVAEWDGRAVPGTDLVVELGRTARQVVGWANYMGNCIGQPWYVEGARAGKYVLMALRDEPGGRIAANVDIRRRFGGWHVEELKGRFNEPLAASLREHVERWARSLPTTARPPVVEPAPPVPPPRSRNTSHRRPTRRTPALTTETRGALATEVARTLTAAADARRTYLALADALGHRADPTPEAAVTALNRLSRTELADLLRRAMSTGLTARTLWQATATRPLTAAVTGLGPDPQLARLTVDAPLPRALRILVRQPDIAPARGLDVLARSLRAALGTLAMDGTLLRSVAEHPSPELVCALVVRTTCDSSPGEEVTPLTAPGTTEVPGFPPSDLRDDNGPWRRALPAAAELAARVELFDRQVAARGLCAPRALLAGEDWPTFWQRTHRPDRRG